MNIKQINTMLVFFLLLSAYALAQNNNVENEENDKKEQHANVEFFFTKQAQTNYKPKWEKIGKLENGNVVEFDSKSVEIQNGIIYIWFKENFNNKDERKMFIENQTINKQNELSDNKKLNEDWSHFKYILTYEALNCDNDEYAILEVIFSNENKTPIEKIDFREFSRFMNIKENSKMHDKFEFICKYKDKIVKEK